MARSSSRTRTRAFLPWRHNALTDLSFRPIYANVGLLDAIPSRESGDGGFQVVARTSNAPLDLSVFDLPLDADAHIAVSSSNGGAKLRLPPAFDGGFQLHTVNALSEVRFDADVPDPTDSGRERRMFKRRIDQNRLVGTVGWVESEFRQEARSGVRPEDGGQRLWGSRPVGSDRSLERRRRFMELFGELEGERRHVGMQTSPDVWPAGWRDWNNPAHGNHSSSALVVSINGPAVLDLT